jgi:hypothetical protein
MSDLFEPEYLLSNTVDTPTQRDVSPTKYPCTGFCYNILMNKEVVVSKYMSNKTTDYYNLIETCIKRAGFRKLQNSKINEEGEFIDEETIKTDFPQIVNKTNYSEVCLITDLEMENFSNDFFVTLLSVSSPLGAIIVNRSNETILFIRLSEDSFLLVDSHQSKHGRLNSCDVIRYITKNGVTKGVIQIGIYDPYIR